jgi:type IV pilus assembly protein PilQ
MRLNRILGIFLLLALPGILSATSARQLMDVGVASKDNATTLTIRANGAFQHTEYRPTDNLLLVDLSGVSAAKLENHSQELHGKFPGVSSYHVMGYKGANGANITRVEMALSPDAVVSVREMGSSLALRVTSNSAATTAAAEPAATSSAKSTEPADEAPKASSGHPVQVRNVTLARSKNGYDVEIAASGAVTPKLMKLTGPDRIVIDIPNAVPAAKRQIAVNNSEIKSIRMARYSLNPPATRIVVDLASAHDYELANSGNHLTVKLRTASMAESITAPVATQPRSSEIQAPPVVAQVAATEPTITAIAVPEKTAVPAEPTPSERAAEAAAHFSTPVTDIPVTNANASMKAEPAVNLAAFQAAQPAAAAPAAQSGSCGGNKYNGEPISVNLKDVDLRDFFRLVHDISGLNVVLDPQVKGSLTIVLDDVPWDQALQIVLKNNQLDCELQGNVLRIATTATLKKEADDRRAQIDAQALAVEMTTINRYLSYAVAKDIVPTLKTFLSTRGSIIADERTNSLIISDIPSVIPNVDRLIKELDKKTQEVEIEARVVAANRSFARDIGTQVGFGIGNPSGSTAIGGASAIGSSPTFAPPVPGVIQIGQPAAPGAAPQLVQIPLFSNLGAVGPTSGFSFLNLGAQYRVDAVLTMAESRGLIKILSRPRVVTQNNIPATVKQGIRIPIVTLAQLGGPPTTTYVDAYLRLQVKPQITAEGTIFLNVDVENTTADFTRQVQGNPTLVTEQATTQVLITDGGTVVIGGVIQTNNNVGIQQVPLLGNIPVFGNLFKRRTVSTSVQELIFFITPKIVQT